MPEERIVTSELAVQLGVHKATIFKVLRRLNLQHELRRDAERGGQQVATITAAQAAAVTAELRRSPGLEHDPDIEASLALSATLPDETGVFYLIQLEPDHDRGRFKVGFTINLESRLQKHRCSAPFARYVHTWPCRRTWERAAIDSVTQACEQLHTEVFRAQSLDAVLSRAHAFFSVMPVPVSIPNDDERQASPGEAV